jgi:hypothetical protein
MGMMVFGFGVEGWEWFDKDACAVEYAVGQELACVHDCLIGDERAARDG